MDKYGGFKPLLFCSFLMSVGLVIQSWPAEFKVTGLFSLISLGCLKWLKDR